MQANTSGSVRSSASGKRQDKAKTGGTASTYQATFANKDMSVNQKYAQYRERFGSTQAVVKNQTADVANLNQEMAVNQRREENKVDSRSPDF